MGPYLGDMKSGKVELRFAPASGGWQRGGVMVQLRRLWWRWCTALWVRQRARAGDVVVVVGWAGTGKSSLCDRAGLTTMPDHLVSTIGLPEMSSRPDYLDRLLGKRIYALDDVIAFPAEELLACVTNLRGRGFVIVAQMCNDLDVRRITNELLYHHRVVILHLNRMYDIKGPDVQATSEWVQAVNVVNLAPPLPGCA